MLCLRLALPASGSPPQATLLAFDLAFCCCAALAAAVYCFATFTISRALRDLLTSVGFAALSGSAGLQALVDLAGRTPSAHEHIMAAGVLYASGAFCAASMSSKAWRPESRAGSCLQLAGGWLFAAAFPLVALRRVIGEIAVVRSVAPDAAAHAYATESLAAAAAVGLVVAAILANCRRYGSEDEGMPGVECYFYITYAFAALARAVSFARFDAWWICSQALFLESWLVFLSATAIENAAAHKENRDRVAEMEALHQVSWTLVGVQTPAELLNLLAQTVREQLDAAIAVVYLADESREALEVAAASGPEVCLTPPGTTYKVVSADRRPGFHTGHTARAFTTKEVQVAQDVFVDVELVHWRMIARDAGCAVSLPLVDRGETTGVLDLYFSDRQLLTQQRLKLLSTIAAAATPAVETARATRLASAGAADFKLAA